MKWNKIPAFYLSLEYFWGYSGKAIIFIILFIYNLLSFSQMKIQTTLNTHWTQYHTKLALHPHKCKFPDGKILGEIIKDYISDTYYYVHSTH